MHVDGRVSKEHFRNVQDPVFLESIFRRHERAVGTEALGTHVTSMIDVAVGIGIGIERRHGMMGQDRLHLLLSLVDVQEGSWEEGWKSVLTVVCQAVNSWIGQQEFDPALFFHWRA